MVTFRISCLLTIPSEAGKLQYVFEIEEKGNSFACFHDCIFHSRGVLQVREDIEKQCNSAKKC